MATSGATHGDLLVARLPLVLSPHTVAELRLLGFYTRANTLPVSQLNRDPLHNVYLFLQDRGRVQPPPHAPQSLGSDTYVTRVKFCRIE